MTETAAAAAGGGIGAAAGKKVSDGITAVFEKVDKQGKKAAETPEVVAPKSRVVAPVPGPKQAAVVQGSPGILKGDSVPPPPPLPRKATIFQPATPPPPPPPEPMVLAAVAPPPIPRAPVTLEDLSTVAKGATRQEVLKLGKPAARIMMVEEGHLVELYRYMSHDMTLGVVRLSDGVVSSVSVRR